MKQVTQNLSSKAVVLKLGRASKSLEGLLKTAMAGPAHRISDSVGRPENLPFSQLPSPAEAADLDHSFENHCSSPSSKIPQSEY